MCTSEKCTIDRTFAVFTIVLAFIRCCGSMEMMSLNISATTVQDSRRKASREVPLATGVEAYQRRKCGQTTMDTGTEDCQSASGLILLEDPWRHPKRCFNVGSTDLNNNIRQRVRQYRTLLTRRSSDKSVVKALGNGLGGHCEVRRQAKLWNAGTWPLQGSQRLHRFTFSRR